MKIIVGLGNPGDKYKNTRHNLGFMFVDEVAKKNNVAFGKEKYGGITAEITKNSEKIILLKPQKFINLSGEVIKKYIDFYKLDIQDLLVISDDLDTPVGKLRIRYKGSSGGHNGLKNIEHNLKTSEYKRIKIGISSTLPQDKIDYVLGKLSEDDNSKIKKIISRSNDIMSDYLTMSFDNLMNKYN